VISVASDGTRGNGDSRGGSISADGRFVAFASLASNPVAGDSNVCGDADGGRFNCDDIFVRDRVAGTTQRVSLSSTGEQAEGRSRSVALSPDGRFAAFESNASNLVGGDTNGLSDIFVRELGGKAAGQGGSLLLNGTTGYGEAPDAPELNPSSWTFEVWFKDANPTFGHARTRILTKGDVSLSDVPYFASIDSNVLYVGARSGGQANVVTVDLGASSPAVTPNAWHHLAATFDAATRTLTVYIDGVQRARQALSFVPAGNSAPLIVGRSGAAGDYWRGKLDDLRIWNVARSAAEVSANYRTTFSTPPPGLVGYWRFDEGSGTTAFDKGGASAQNMTLFGGAGFSAEVP